MSNSRELAVSSLCGPDTATDTIVLTCVDMNRRAAKHYLSGADVLYGTSLENGPQGSGIPARDLSIDVIGPDNAPDPIAVFGP